MALARVVTLNARRFTSPSKEDATAAVVACLRRLPQPFSLLALTEVDKGLRPEALDAVGSALGLPHHAFFGHAFGGRYGNALLSAAPLVLPNPSEVHLDGGSVVEFGGKRKRIARGLLVASTVLGSVPVRVGVTHWDHISEVERRIQAAHTLAALDDAGGPSEQSLLLGDLNALDRADYSSAEWAAHEAHNASRGWEPPADSAADGSCLSLLRKAGFQDCHAWSSRTVAPCMRADDEERWRSPPWSAHAHEPSTPHYRIDYVHARAAGGGGGPSLVPVSAEAGPADEQASDHSPVMVSFGEKRPQPAL